MGTTNQHLQQARENYDFYFHRTDLTVGVDRQWAAVLLFYSALHLVDAFLAAQSTPFHPGSHEIRDSCIARLRDLHPIARAYGTLQDRSKDARYRMRPFTQAEVRTLETVQFAAIRQHVTGLLGVTF